MKISSVKYLVGEGAKNAWVNRLMTIASVGVLVACMVIIGLAILISENVNKAVGKLEQQNVVMAYMKDYNWALYGDDKDNSSDDTSAVSSEETASSDTQQTEEQADENGIKSGDYVIHNADEAKALCEEIAKIDNVASVTYVSSSEGLESVKKTMLEGQESYFTFLDDKYGNPMSDAAKITMKDMARFDETIEQIKKIDGINKIQSQNDLADKITAIKRGVGIAGFWIIAILMIIALVIVSNTIRVTMYNRKHYEGGRSYGFVRAYSVCGRGYDNRSCFGGYCRGTSVFLLPCCNRNNYVHTQYLGYCALQRCCVVAAADICGYRNFCRYSRQRYYDKQISAARGQRVRRHINRRKNENKIV